MASRQRRRSARLPGEGKSGGTGAAPPCRNRAATSGLNESLQTQNVQYLFQMGCPVKYFFVAGTAAGIRDIPDTIVHASAAALQVAAYLRKVEAVQ